MYFFDPEDFKCIIPDWEDYGNALRQLSSNYVKCINENYEAKIGKYLNTPCGNKIVKLYDDFVNIYYVDYMLKTNNLINSLIANTFVESLYIEYLESYNQLVFIGDEINLLLNGNSCDLISFKNDVGVDLTTITGINHKLSLCKGVYIKQTDAGSEFIGDIKHWDYFYNRS